MLNAYDTIYLIYHYPVIKLNQLKKYFFKNKIMTPS